MNNFHDIKKPDSSTLRSRKRAQQNRRTAKKLTCLSGLGRKRAGSYTRLIPFTC